MNREIGREIAISLSEMDIGDDQKLLNRAQQLASQQRFHGHITNAHLRENNLVFEAHSDFFEDDNQEQEQLSKMLKQASRFLRELGIYIFGNNVATARNLWEIQWRPQIEHLMNNAITHDVVDNHLAAIMLMIPCIDRTFTFQYPQKHFGYTIEMLKWAFPEKEVSISATEYETCITGMHDGLVNGLKHDSFLREIVYISNAEKNPRPFYVKGDNVIVNPHAFWTHLRNRIDGYYADKPRNITIGAE